eukprot:542623-Pelagomonas_calceolata.AAC.5
MRCPGSKRMLIHLQMGKYERHGCHGKHMHASCKQMRAGNTRRLATICYALLTRQRRCSTLACQRGYLSLPFYPLLQMFTSFLIPSLER